MLLLQQLERGLVAPPVAVALAKTVGRVAAIELVELLQRAVHVTAVAGQLAGREGMRDLL